MCLRWITLFWRYRGYSKYVFRIAEEYIYTIKKIRTKIIFHLGENWFSKFQNFQNFQNLQKSKFWEKHLKIKISRKNRKPPKTWKVWKFGIFNLLFFEKLYFQIFFLKLWFLKNLKFLKFWKSIFSKMKNYFRLDFLKWSWYILPQS